MMAFWLFSLCDSHHGVSALIFCCCLNSLTPFVTPFVTPLVSFFPTFGSCGIWIEAPLRITLEGLRLRLRELLLRPSWLRLLLRPDPPLRRRAARSAALDLLESEARVTPFETFTLLLSSVLDCTHSSIGATLHGHIRYDHRTNKAAGRVL